VQDAVKMSAALTATTPHNLPRARTITSTPLWTIGRTSAATKAKHGSRTHCWRVGSPA